MTDLGLLVEEPVEEQPASGRAIHSKLRVAKAGDIVVERTCHCGTTLQRIGFAAVRCQRCKRVPRAGMKLRLLAVGWESAQ